NAGEIPIYEPGLEPLVEHNLAQGRLVFTTDAEEAVKKSHVIFIAVGTPPGEDGSADLKYVLAVARTIGNAMEGEKIVITKSTVPVGTAKLVKEAIEEVSDHPVHVCSNPEFLKEGAAVEDFMKPDRVVLGVESEYAGEVLTDLYSPFVRTGNEILLMDIASAELTKYAANAMLATRISFMNAVARLCDKAGADVNQVRLGIGTDSRIGPSFLFPGVGYGGSCFPKDVKALIRTSKDFGLDPSILLAVEEVNETQKQLLLEQVVERFGEDLSGRTFAVWGLAFKPNTDDMREAPSLVTIAGLLERGARIVAHDPVAMPEAGRELGDTVEFRDTNYGTLDDADALVIHTEWHPYRRPDFPRMKRLMKGAVIFDGRNIYAPEKMREIGFEYYSVGRQPVRVLSAGESKRTTG
ncbi:MAG: UDP-glucose/GDP-mannose dehydrogenase family protein, partial [Gemmatimonadota bacterium]